MKLAWNEEKHTYEIVNYESLEKVKIYLETIAHKDLVIQSEEDFKAVKQARTELNNFVKEVSGTRKQMTALVLSQFAPQMQALEKLASEYSQNLTDKINAYKPPKEKEKTYKLIIKSNDLKAIKKIKEYANKYGVEIDESF